MDGMMSPVLMEERGCVIGQQVLENGAKDDI